MIYTVFDLETSGLVDGRDDVLQFAYIVTDSESGKLIRANQFYLWEDNYQWSQEAFAVHGISKEFLKSLPKEEMPRKYQEMYTVLSRANVVGYNSKKFDWPFVDAFLTTHAVRPLPPDSHTDVMLLAQKATGKKKKLTVLTEELGFTPELVQGVNAAWFGKAAKAHDASYDVTATALCLTKMRGLGYV